MTRWQQLAETNPSASPEQKTLMGLMVAAELENSPLPAKAGSGPPAGAPSAEERGQDQ